MRWFLILLTAAVGAAGAFWAGTPSPAAVPALEVGLALPAPLVPQDHDDTAEEPLPPLEREVSVRDFVAEDDEPSVAEEAPPRTGGPRGRILDPEGRPVADARLRVQWAGPRKRRPKPHSYRATTDAEGRWSLPPLPAGRWRLIADDGMRASDSRTTDLAAEAPQNTTSTDLVLQAGFALGGVVVDSDGRPLEGVELHLRTWRRGRRPDPLSSRKTVSAADGTFTFTGLREARARLGGRSETHFQLKGWSGNPKGDTWAQVTMGRFGRLTGQVLDADGQAVGGARLTAPGTGVVAADEEGRFVIENVRPRPNQPEVTVCAIAPDARSAASLSVPLKLGQSREGLAVRLEAAGVLTGRVTRTDGQPLAETRVEFRDRSGRRGAWGRLLREIAKSPSGKGLKIRGNRDYATTDADGRFRYPLLWEGRWQVQARKGGYFRRQPLVQIEAGPGVSRELQLVLARGGVVRGRFFGLPEGTQQVDLRYRDERGRERGSKVKPDEENRFELGPLRPGRYTLSVFVGGESPGFARSDEIVLGYDQTVEGVPLVFEPAPVVTGTVRDTSGQPVRRARVYLRPRARGLRSRRVNTDREGRFVLSGMLPGRYRLEVSARGFLSKNLPDREIGIGERRDVNLELSRGARARVIVRGPRGLQNRARVWLREASSGRSRSGRTDGNGVAGFSTLRSGKARILVRAGGSGDMRYSATAEAIIGGEGTETTIVVVLREAPWCEGSFGPGPRPERVFVRARSNGNRFTREGRLDAAGRFLVTGLYPGRYQLGWRIGGRTRWGPTVNIDHGRPARGLVLNAGT